jgi:hypothetical protein
MRALAMLAACTALVSCDDPTAPERLSSAEARWERAGHDSYSFTAEHSCFCIDDARGPVRIVVRDGAIVSVTMISTGASVADPLWFTIDDLFDLVRDELERLPERLDVEYDRALGFPVRIDYGTPENDGGGTIHVRQLTRETD